MDEEQAGPIVRLNLRGREFVTARDTLLSKRGSSSFFDALLSGRLASTKIGSALFLDRDPRAFETLLTFLSTGFLPLPKDPNELFILLAEADFYCIALKDGLRSCVRCHEVYYHSGHPLPERACRHHPGTFGPGELKHVSTQKVKCTDHSAESLNYLSQVFTFGKRNGDSLGPFVCEHCFEVSPDKVQRSQYPVPQTGPSYIWKDVAQEHRAVLQWSCCKDPRADAPACALGAHVPSTNAFDSH